MTIRNLILDMGNVLLSWDPRAFALRAAENQPDADILYAALFGAPDWPLHDEGLVDVPTLLARALARTPQRLHETMKRLHEQWPYWMAPVPGATAFVAAARAAGLRIYLLSNAGTCFPDALRERDFYPCFDGMMVSAHEQLVKPDPRIYQRLFERFGLIPGQCLFVDDLAANVAAAIASGMPALQFEGDWGKVADALRAGGVEIRW